MGRLVSNVHNNDPDRLQRILDAKSRLIGVDKQAIDRQVEEKKAKHARQQQDELLAAHQVLHHDALVCAQHAEAERVRKAISREVEAFRKSQQGKHSTREWDLNDPSTLRQSSPARVADDDPRCGPSSLQRFAGEDLSKAAREAAQQEQCQRWWAQQQAEKEAARRAEQEERQRLAGLINWQDAVQLQAAGEERAARQQAGALVHGTNARLAEEQRLRAAEQAAQEAAAKEAELAATLESPWLNEDPSLAASALSPTRVRKDHWKGMSAGQVGDILATQLRQVEEVRERREGERQWEQEYGRYQAQVNTARHQAAQSIETFRRQQAAAAAEVLQRQMEENTRRTVVLNQSYAGQITPEYFSQFGTSHR